MNIRTLQFLLFLLVPIINFGSNFFFDSPFTEDDKVLIQPAEYAFSIWGPIFLGMIIYSWFQMQEERTQSPYLKQATQAGILAALASITFVPISHSNLQWLSFINIIWHLVALIWLFVSLRKQVTLEKNPYTRWYYLPTQLYLGWICAATAVSTALMLTEVGLVVDIQLQAIITAVIIGALIIIGAIMTNQKGGIIPVVFIWALIGILVENGEFEIIKSTSILGILILAYLLGVKIAKRRQLLY